MMNRTLHIGQHTLPIRILTAIKTLEGKSVTELDILYSKMQIFIEKIQHANQLIVNHLR